MAAPNDLSRHPSSLEYEEPGDPQGSHEESSSGPRHGSNEPHVKNLAVDFSENTLTRSEKHENSLDAPAHDDKQTEPPTAPKHENCLIEGCKCREPFQHRSHLHDIPHHIEPMVSSLIRLESQVGKLIHHVIKSGESLVHTGHMVPHDSNAKRYDEAEHPGHAQRPLETPADSLARLEARVGELVEQVGRVMKEREEWFERVGGNLVPPARDGGGAVGGK